MVGPNREDSLQPVIGLGGSAGSLNALRTFFSHMNTDSDLAFVVIIHDSIAEREARQSTVTPKLLNNS